MLGVINNILSKGLLVKLFKDPVYNYITCSQDEVCIIDSPWFQRLRHCAQNGPAKLVYPTLFGSRFEHSLGVMHLAEKMLRSVLIPSKYINDNTLHNFLNRATNDIKNFYGNHKNNHDIVEVLVRWIRLAGLCHDLGHFPLSHTLESVFDNLFWANSFPLPNPRRACHEVISAEFVRQIAYGFDKDPIYNSLCDKGKKRPIISKKDAHAIILLLLLPQSVKIGNTPIDQTIFSTLHKIIVGTYDADRLDYLQRDTHLVSANFGLIDVERFFDSLRLVEQPLKKNSSATKNRKTDFVIMPAYKGMSAIETLLLERYKQKKWIHSHHKVVFFDQIVKDAAGKVIKNKQHLFFQNYVLPSEFKSAIKTPAILADKFREANAIRLAKFDPNKELLPLSVFPKKDKKGFRILNCKAFVSDHSSHFIDDLWFSQECRNNKSKKFALIKETLVNRRATSLSLWKGPDMFRTFWKSFSEKLLSFSGKFWDAVGCNYPEDIGPIADKLRIIFADEGEKYEDLFGLKRIAHFKRIEKYLKSHLPICKKGTLDIRIAPVRWKDLFFDKKGQEDNSNKVYISKCRFCDIDNDSGLIKSLVGLREEVLFYIYLVGEEKEICKLKKSLKSKDSQKERLFYLSIAETFADAIVERLKSYCSDTDHMAVARKCLEL